MDNFKSFWYSLHHDKAYLPLRLHLTSYPVLSALFVVILFRDELKRHHLSYLPTAVIFFSTYGQLLLAPKKKEEAVDVLDKAEAGTAQCKQAEVQAPVERSLAQPPPQWLARVNNILNAGLVVIVCAIFTVMGRLIKAEYYTTGGESDQI